MNVSLTPELEQLIEQKVKGGMYNSASEVIRAGLRLLQEQDELRQIRLRELKQEVKKGLDQIDRGEIVDGDEVFQELRARNLKYKQSKAKKK
jgi:antitoxin ParD1/3/4